MVAAYHAPEEVFDCNGFDVLAITHSPRDWEIIINLASNSKVTVDCTLLEGALTNVLGDLNAEQVFNTLLDVVGQYTNCVYGEWSETDCGSCLSYNADFSLNTGIQTRTFTGDSNVCTETTRVRSCDDISLPFCTAEDTFRPYAAERGIECRGRAYSQGCEPTSPRNVNSIARGQWQESAGCYCDNVCVTEGDCCQGFFTECARGVSNTDAKALYLDENWERFTCTDCTSPIETRGDVGDASSESYRCGCDEESFNNNLFCGGANAARDCNF